MSIEVRLDQFSGPLDLLLHLIKSNEMDIYDIRIVEITEQYLNVIDQMKKLDLDVAGEFLLMAATLIHIKSRMLLPVSEDLEEEEGQDPREELIKRLLEYQRYKEAAELFQELPQLERDVFSSAFKIETLVDDDGDQQQIAIGIYQLADAFHKLIKSKPPEIFHEVVQETLSVAAYIEFIVDSLRGQTRQSFKSFFIEAASRDEIVVTFLAMLELVKMRMINVEQVDDFSDVWISAAVPDDQLDAAIFDREKAAMNNLRMIVEAMIFAADNPLSIDRLVNLLEHPRAEIKEVVTALKREYKETHRGFYLAEVAGGYQFRTHADLAPYLRQLGNARTTKFSQAAMETLSIVAYRQPVTRAEIEYLRGVDSGGVMKTLLDKSLLKILGKKDVPGKPLMYGTSRNFLELFGLHSLSDLPTLKEFSSLDPELVEAHPLTPEE